MAYGICDNCGEYGELERDPVTLEFLCEKCIEDEESEDDD